MTDIVERLRKKILADAHERGEIGGVLAERLIRERQEAADEIERLRARLETVRHEAQAATKLVLEHQSKNCHLHADIKRLREALREIAGLPYSQERDNAAQDWAREALGDN